MSPSKSIGAVALVFALSGAALSLPVCMAASPAGVASQPRASSVVIATGDVDRTARWYSEKLAFRTVAERNTVQGRRIVLERAGMLLEVAEQDAPLLSALPVDVEITASLPQPKVSILVNDVDAETERLRASGVAVLYDPDDDLDGRFRASWIRDDGGRIVELREALSDTSGDRP